MDMFKEDVNREFSRIKEKLEKTNPLNEEDLKIILLSLLAEEDLHEGK
jgi:hypothetical protein